MTEDGGVECPGDWIARRDRGARKRMTEDGGVECPGDWIPAGDIGWGGDM